MLGRFISFKETSRRVSSVKVRECAIMCVTTISFRHNRGRRYINTVSEALLVSAMLTYSGRELHIVCMHRMEKISLYLTVTAAEARTRETSKLCLKEVVKIAIQSLPPEADI